MTIYYSALSLFLNILLWHYTFFLLPEFLWPNSLYRAARLQTSNGFFCSINHLSGGGVNANHDLPSLAHKNKTENDSRLLKNREGNRDDEWTFCRRQEADIALFLQETCKNKKHQKNLWRKLVDNCPKEGNHKQRTLKNRNKQSGSKWSITSKHVFPKRTATMNDRTEKPKIPFKFVKHAV